MDKENLFLLTFTKKEAREKLRWEESREFEYNDQMYDVVFTETKGDSVFYHCFWDKEETVLNIQIKKLVAQALGQHPQNKESQKRLITFLQTLYLPHHFIWNPCDPRQDKKSYPDNQFRCLSAFSEPDVPPPRLS